MQFGLSHFLSPIDRPLLEHAHLHAQLLYPTILTLTLQFFRIRSAYVTGLIASVLLIGAIGEAVQKKVHKVDILWGYAVPMVIMVALGVEGVTSVSTPEDALIRPSTFSLRSLDVWAKKPQRSISSPPSLPSSALHSSLRRCLYSTVCPAPTSA